MDRKGNRVKERKRNKKGGHLLKVSNGLIWIPYTHLRESSGAPARATESTKYGQTERQEEDEEK